MLTKIIIWAYLITIPINLWFISLTKGETDNWRTDVKVFIYIFSILVSPMLFLAVQIKAIIHIIKDCKKHEKEGNKE